MMNKCSVIIGHRNDRNDLLMTLESLIRHNKKSIGEIIVVDDCSDDPLVVSDIFSDMKVIHSKNHTGIGGAFDIGVEEAEYDTVFLMGADIRFDGTDAVGSMVDCSLSNPQSLIGCKCYACHPDIDLHKKTDRLRSGAEIVWKMTNVDLSVNHQYKRNPLFRDILQAKWLKNESSGVVDIPCVLGATYAVQKEWYRHIKGFEGHRVWGGLEPYISLKSHLAGGGVKLMADVHTGHRFGRSISRGPDTYSYYYNKVFMCYMLFDDEIRDELLEHVKLWKDPINADKHIKDNWSEYQPLKEYYQSIFTTDIRDTICFDSFKQN